MANHRLLQESIDEIFSTLRTDSSESEFSWLSWTRLTSLFFLAIYTSEVVPFLTVNATFIVYSLVLGATVFALSVSRVCFLFLFIGETILSGFEFIA